MAELGNWNSIFEISRFIIRNKVLFPEEKIEGSQNRRWGLAYGIPD
jgi:hypothetical protein